MKKRLLSIFLSLVMLAAMFPTAVFATEESDYVATIVDKENGEYATLEAALLAAEEGDTVLVKEGEYEGIAIKYGKDGNKLPDNLTIIGDGEVTIDGINFNGNSYCRIPDGLTVENINFTGNFHVNSFNVNDLSIIECDFSDEAVIKLVGAKDKGTGKTRTNTNVLIQGCTFGATGATDKTSILIQQNSDGITIENNTFNGATNNAIQIAGTAAGIVIEGNEISNTGDRGIRLSKVNGTVEIKNNSLGNAADSAGEVFKVSSVLEEGVVTFTGNFYEGVEWNPATIEAGAEEVSYTEPFAAPEINEDDIVADLGNLDGVGAFVDEEVIEDLVAAIASTEIETSAEFDAAVQEKVAELIAANPDAVVERNVEVKVADVKIGADAAAVSKTLVLEISPVVTATQDGTVVGEAYIDAAAPVTLTFGIPEAFAKDGDELTIIHTKKDGQKFTYTATVEDGKITFVNPNGFSTFEIVAAVDTLEFVLEHYDVAYEMAYQYAKGAGYIDDAIEALEAVKAAIDAVDVDALDIPASVKEELAAAADEVSASINDLIVTLENDDLDTFAKLLANGGERLGHLYGHLTELAALAESAGIDLYGEAVAIYEREWPVIEQNMIDAYGVAYDYVSGVIDDIYTDIVDEIGNIVSEYGPDAEAFVREWLYENPKAVIDAVLAYGEDVDAFINYWSYYAELILGPAWGAYGDEVTAALEELMAALQAGAAELGAEAIDALVEYIDSLNIDGQIEEIADAVKDGALAISGETLTKLNTVLDELEINVTNSADAIVDELEALAAAEDAADAKAAIETAINNVLDQKDALLTEIAKIKGDVENAADKLVDAAEVVTDLDSAVIALNALLADPAQFDFTATVEAVGNIVTMVMNAVGEAADAAAVVMELSDEIAAAGVEIDGAIVDIYDDALAAADAVKGILTDAGADAEALMGEAYTAIEALVTTTVDNVTGTVTVIAADAAELLALAETEMANAVAGFMADLETALYNALTADIIVKCGETYYFAEGDADADALAALLGKGAIKAETLADADVVIVNYNGANFEKFIEAQAAGIVAEAANKAIDEALVQFVDPGHKNYAMYKAEIETVLSEKIDLTAVAEELDWTKTVLDETAVNVLKETLAGIMTTVVDNTDLEAELVLDVNELADLGLTKDILVTIDLAAIACEALENVAYAYVAYLAEYGAALDEIQATADEVIIVGMAAPETLKLNIGAFELDLSDFADEFGVVVEFINAHYFGYAMANGENTTYVADAADLEAALNVTTEHAWVAKAIEGDDENHKMICCCGAEGIVAHTFDKNDKCTECGYEKKTIELPPTSGSIFMFTDVNPSHPFYKEIMWAYRKGFVQGYADGSYGPSNSLTRQHVWMVLARMSGEEPADMAEAREWAMSAGVSDGTNPGAAVTRQQMVAMFYRYATLKKYDVTAEADISTYPDAAGVAAYAKDAMEWAIAEGIVNGYTDGTLKAPGLTNRGQFAAVLYRFFKAVK